MLDGGFPGSSGIGIYFGFFLPVTSFRITEAISTVAGL
jgi:hypothetical protein